MHFGVESADFQEPSIIVISPAQLRNFESLPPYQQEYRPTKSRSDFQSSPSAGPTPPPQEQFQHAANVVTSHAETIDQGLNALLEVAQTTGPDSEAARQALYKLAQSFQDAVLKLDGQS